MNRHGAEASDSPPKVTPRDLARSPSLLLAFGLGSGLFPVAPGTAGTLLAVPFAVALKTLGTAWFWGALVAAFVAGLPLCNRVNRKLGSHDHPGIVWDEIVGYWLAVAFIPPQWNWLLAAFVLFRFFDILKPWPIRQLDRGVSGGLGVMLDDVVAGALTALVLALAGLLV